MESDFFMNLEDHRIAILSKINYSYFLYKKTLKDSIGKKSNDYLLNSVQLDCYRMYIINYLSVLIGTSKNDKVSIFRQKNNNDEISNFYDKYEIDIKNLKISRNKVYAHFDLDFIDYIKCIPFDFIDICIKFLNRILNYQGFKFDETL